MDRLTAAYGAAADPGQAAPMAAYMKDAAPFLGIRTPLRRQLSRTVTKDTPRPSETDCAALALRCWGLAEREYRYFAVDHLRRHVSRCSSGFLPVARHVIVTTPSAGPCASTPKKTDPDAVRAFVAAERALLSPLSVREALKNL
jgi:3-methyladenine DNA glycosylase AlkD